MMDQACKDHTKELEGALKESFPNLMEVNKESAYNPTEENVESNQSWDLCLGNRETQTQWNNTVPLEQSLKHLKIEKHSILSTKNQPDKVDLPGNLNIDSDSEFEIINDVSIIAENARETCDANNHQDSSHLSETLNTSVYIERVSLESNYSASIPFNEKNITCTPKDIRVQSCNLDPFKTAICDSKPYILAEDDLNFNRSNRYDSEHKPTTHESESAWYELDNNQSLANDSEKRASVAHENSIIPGTTKKADNSWELIKRLGLEKFYKNKMSKNDVLGVGKYSIHDNQPCSEQELAFCFMEKLSMLDYRARDIQCKNEAKTILSRNNSVNKIELDAEKSKVNADECELDADKCEMDANDFLCDNDDEDDNILKESTNIHPMDIQLAIFHCSDIFLWQYILTKLSVCQYALPLLVPNPFTSEIVFPSWSFRELKKSWKIINISNNQLNEKCKTKSIYEACIPFVSFIRFGCSSVSKSQLMNSLMNKQRHNTFFHRNCRGGSNKSTFMDGVVDMTWYCPGGRDDEIFDDCIAFTNLHGDITEHETQQKFVLGIASVIVLLFSDKDLNEKEKTTLNYLVKSPKPLICLYVNKEMISKGKNRTKVKLAAMNRNEAELMIELISTIKHLLALSNSTISIEASTDIARKLNISVDEDNEHCKEGEALANTLVKQLGKEKLSNIKQKFLPLQGKELWHMWCKKSKELTRLQFKENRSIEQHRSDIEIDSHKIRLNQVKSASPFNDLIESFIEIMSSNSDQSKDFFLRWLCVFFNKLTVNELSGLNHMQHTNWLEVQKLKQDGQKTDEKQQIFDDLTKEIDNSNIGLEHLLRELGQIYEAFDTLKENFDKIKMLPIIAADMLIAGNPIELMDGDACHVPMTWICSVLDKVIEKVGDKKIFVLSVLGIQSSGKSTMLNAMFGLQFAVSAGRCTIGAFMQLVKVQEDIQLEIPFDYILVVDTEGIHAAEIKGKSMLHHDNELATFVIGLGTMTLINIFGENPSYVQDILQIAVQAFLRMKKVNLHPSCMFVHQNVGEITADEKNMEGRQRLQERLDDMTQIAAKQEVCDVTCFSDVIKFDINTNVHYFNHLWDGNPPMAPPNPSYSENIQNMKRMLISSISQQNVLKISEFKTRIQDLWTGLLAEDFVFSFKNTLEIAAYRRLENMYGLWTWQLRSSMLNIENKLRNRIKNERLQVVEYRYIEDQVSDVYTDVNVKVEHYFSEDEDKEILIQWKVNFKKKLENLKHDLISISKRKCDELIRMKKGCFNLDEKKADHEEKLYKMSKELASQLKASTLGKREIEENFEKHWNEWVGNLTLKMDPPLKINVKSDAEKILCEVLDTRLVRLSIDSKIYRSLPTSVDLSCYMSIKRNFGWKYNFEAKDQCCSNKLTKDIIHEIEDYVTYQMNSQVDYNCSYIHEIINKIRNSISEFEKKEIRFKFNKEYETNLCIYMCFKVAKNFEKMHQAFFDANDPLAYLHSKRSEYLHHFTMCCQGTTSTTALADFVADKLKASILQAIYDKTTIDIAGEMRSNYPAFSGNRSNLENYILLHLAENENFKDYIDYIHSPKMYFQDFIQDCVQDYCLNKKCQIIVEVLNNNLKFFQNCVVSAISSSTKFVQNNGGDVSMWLDEFSRKLVNDLQFSKDDLRGVRHQDITDIDFLQKTMTQALDNVASDIKLSFNSEYLVNMDIFRIKPHEILSQQLCGCLEQCPRCSSICTNTIPNHGGDHNVPFHRPEAIRGGKWYKTNNFVIEICTSLVASDYYLVKPDDTKIPYKNYREMGPSYANWRITPDVSSPIYWKWFVCKFRNQLEKLYQLKFQEQGNIPEQWTMITKNAVISELKKQMGLQQN